MNKNAISLRFLSPLAACVLFLSTVGCPGPTYPNCKNDDQCKTGSGADAKSGVCVFGKCQECAKDTDCADGKQCVDNMCLLPCTSDDACTGSTHCEAGYCKANCVDSSSCGSGQTCNGGRCVAQGSTCTDQGDCGAGFKCESGLCTRSDTAASSIEKDCQKSGRVNFDFNVFSLGQEATKALDDLAVCLRSHADWKILVAGNTDDRGSTEYNLSLGESRAKSVANYLSLQGVDSSRIQTVSYGEEKPVDPAHTEAAWAMNRRADITVQ
jgi:peptidoglycan-associated lipoprotein